MVRLIANALVGPIITMISFVCSVGNIPLASLLWSHAISFGGVISFIYADLIVIPIIIIYGKYYGLRGAAWISGIFYVSMVLAGIIVDLIFSALGLIPQGLRHRARWNTRTSVGITRACSTWPPLFSRRGFCFCILGRRTKRLPAHAIEIVAALY